LSDPKEERRTIMANSKGEFVANIKELRTRAREHLNDGAITSNYGGDPSKTVEILNDALATELVCVLRYKFHYVAAQGIHSEGIKAEFLQHAQEEQAHADRLAERINQLGGKPNFDPATLAGRSATEYKEGSGLVDMIKEDLVAERIAVQVYRDMIRFFGDSDPTTRRMLEEILAQEEEHANDMHDLLVAHEGAAAGLR
jgi:bacterioferritin